MKYIITENPYTPETGRQICFIENEYSSKIFYMNTENSDYVQFLEQANLTDSDIQEFKSNVWFDLHEGDTV